MQLCMYICKQKTADEMRINDWRSDVCSSYLNTAPDRNAIIARMTLTELRYLVNIDKERHFGRAAERSFVSQPTLSVAVKKLEDELGVALFERNRGDARPTPVRSEEHTSELQSLMRRSYDVFCLNKKKENNKR